MAVWKRPVVVILAAAAGMCASVPSSQPPVVLSPPAASGAVASVPEPLSTGAQPLPEPARSPRTLSVAASGDVLLHSGLWRQAAQDAAAAGRSGYDFGPLFAAVKPVVADADVAICHPETPVDLCYRALTKQSTRDDRKDCFPCSMTGPKVTAYEPFRDRRELQFPSAGGP